jgi:hypothetical protein
MSTRTFRQRGRRAGRPQPTPSTLKRLFALSGNRCAFPRCESRIVEGSEVLGDVCHIRGNRGPRHDSTQTHAERQHFNNLILFCLKHHRIVDAEPHVYSVENLETMKLRHERKMRAVPEIELAELLPTLIHSLLSNLRRKSKFRIEINASSDMSDPAVVTAGFANKVTSSDRVDVRPGITSLITVSTPDISRLLRASLGVGSARDEAAIEELLDAVGLPLKATILHKLRQDVIHGCLRSRIDMEKGDGVSTGNITDARLVSRHLETKWFPPHLRGIQEEIPSAAFAGALSDSSRQLIEDMARENPEGKIVFDAQGLHVGLIATISAMYKRFSLPVKIRFDALDGSEQFSRLNRINDSVDVIICANANMFTLGKEQAANRYTYFCTFVLQPQYVLMPRTPQWSGGTPKKLIYVEGSSGEEQVLLKRERLVTDGRICRQKIDFHHLPDAVFSLTDGEAVICWDPIARHLGPSLGHIVKTANAYQVATGLYCNASWSCKSRRRNLLALIEALAAAWSIVRSDVAAAALDLAYDSDLASALQKSMLVTPRQPLFV